MALLVLAALVLPGVAQAHHDPAIVFNGDTAVTTPTIDGFIASDEWTDTPSYAVDFGVAAGTVRFKHDGEFLYAALTVTDASIGSKSMGIFFDDDHDGIKEAGEDTVLAFGSPSFGADYFYSTAGPSGATHYSDTETGGTNPPGGGTEEVLGAGQFEGPEATFELRHPLCSDDTVHDFCLTPGQTVGLNLMYVLGGTGFVAPGETAFDPSDWADLKLEAPAPAGRIVFESNRTHPGNLEIYRMNADGSAPTRLTNDPGTDNVPSISPDGTKVAFTSDRAGSQDIWVMGIDGSNPTQLTTDAGIELQPAWSPDGTKIAYHGSSIEQFDIFVVNATGGTPVDVTNTPADEASASWSPDGTQLAFMSDRDFGNEEVYRQNADGTGTATRLTNNPARDADPDWSPDGQKLAFFSDRAGSPFGSVWTINAVDGSDPTNLTDAPIFDADPAWSPDGSKIAFVRDAGGQNFQVWTADADGTNQVNLNPSVGGRNSFPDWGPTAAPSASISIAGPESSSPGAGSAPIVDIPLDAIRGETGTTSATPLEGIPIAGIPIAGIPIGGIPIGGIPIEGIGFTAQNLNQNGLGGVPLSTIPLQAPDRWEAHLALDPKFAGTPPQNVTLAQVLETPVLTGVTLDKLNLASSPIGGIPLAGIALGALPIEGIPIAGIATSTPEQNRAGWCAYINQQPGFTCSGGDSLVGQTMLGLSLQGVPLAGIPIAGIPIAGIDLTGTPIAGIPIAGIDLTGTPIGGIPIAGINMAVSPIAGIPIGGIPLSARNAILTCPTPPNFTCADTDTLGAAKAAGAIKPTARLQDIGYYKNAIGQDITLGELVRGLPAVPPTTLEDLLATVLQETAYDWEALPLPGFPLQDFSDDGGVADYSVTFTASGVPDGTVHVDLPAHARYVEGSTQLTGGLGAATGEPTLALPENELTWSVTGIAPATPYTLTFQAKPGLSLGTESATAELAATALAEPVASPTPATTLITEPGEPANNDPETAQQVQHDTLYLGYTSSGSDRDYLQVEAEAGEQLTIHLSHLKLDADLVVHGPTIAPLRTPHPAPAQPVAGDVPFDLEQRTQSITPEALADVPQSAVGQPVLDISDNRGLADEEVAVVSPEGGTYTIQVSSFDGAFSNEPWMIRVERSPAITLPETCTDPPATGGGETKPMPVVLPTASTLYLFAAKRFGDLYGLQAENDVLAKLQTLAGRTDAAGGAVIPVDTDPDVMTALNARATDSCSPAKANAVVRAVGALLDDLVTPSVKHIVVVGDDTVLPFGRVLDNTAYANERGYASTFFGSSNNQYLSTYALGFLPTDNPLGDVNYAGQGPYVPELALGRLVETPSQIISQIDQYVTRNGTLAPTRALTLGYDFLKDSSTQISAGFKARMGTSNATDLISNIWSKTDLLGAMFPAANAPQIVSLNAHFDHFRSLPADENAAQRETILFTTADLLTRSTSGRVVFTMGCHSALPVSDFVVADVLKPDWAQTYAQTGAVVYMGNTGFGLGDTAAPLYTEKLNVLFAERLDGSMTVGQALAFAKQEYAATPTQSGYHLKVIDQATMMGLPMYRVGAADAATPPLPAFRSTDSATGLPTTSFSVSPTFDRVDTENPAIGSYFVDDDSFAENRRPIQPTTKLDVTQPGLVAHGALITGLTSEDDPGFDAAFSRVVDDLSAFSPELVGDVTFPTKLQSIASVATPLGTRQRLTLFSGQFRSDGIAEAQGIGTQRLFTALSGNVFYTEPNVTDFTPPSFGPVGVTQAGETVGFAVDVTDNVGGAAGVKRAVALYREAIGPWKSIEMSRAGGRWSGAGPLDESDVEWIIQAVDAAGNVGITANKAIGKTVTPPPQPPVGIRAVATGPQTNEWFTGSPDPTVTISGAPGIRYSLDGAPFTLGTSLTVSGTGVHTVDFQGSDGSRGSLFVPIDVSNPTVTVNATYGFGQVAHAVCADSGSGIQSCTVPSPLDTSSAGTKTINVQAQDRAGHSFSATLSYQVMPGWLYTLTGFFPPVDNLPTVNVASAGNSIPVKFSLSGFQGLNVLAPDSPFSQPMSCTTGTTDPIEESAAPGESAFSYDPVVDRYKYVWKTQRSWRGTCRQLVVRLRDGTEKRANFRFK